MAQVRASALEKLRHHEEEGRYVSDIFDGGSVGATAPSEQFGGMLSQPPLSPAVDRPPPPPPRPPPAPPRPPPGPTPPPRPPPPSPSPSPSRSSRSPIRTRPGCSS